MVTLSRDVVCEAGYNFLFQMVIQSFKKKKKKGPTFYPVLFYSICPLMPHCCTALIQKHNSLFFYLVGLSNNSNFSNCYTSSKFSWLSWPNTCPLSLPPKYTLKLTCLACEIIFTIKLALNQLGEKQQLCWVTLSKDTQCLSICSKDIFVRDQEYFKVFLKFWRR